LPRTFDTPLHTTDQSIDRVLNAGMPVILVFTDGQPQPGLEQAMERLAKQHAGQLLVVSAAAKDSPEAARGFNVRVFPAVVAVKGGQEQSKAESIASSDIEAHAAYLLGKGPRPATTAARQPQNSQAAGGNGGSSHQSYASQPSYASYSSPASAAPTGSSSAAGRPVAVTDATFEQQVMRSSTPVLVDFWAEWCGPCRMMEPVLQKLAGEMNGRLTIAKLNVDENPLTGGRFGIQAIPTMMLVKDGRILDRWSGALPEPALRSRLAAHVR